MCTILHLQKLIISEIVGFNNMLCAGSECEREDCEWVVKPISQGEK